MRTSTTTSQGILLHRVVTIVKPVFSYKKTFKTHKMQQCGVPLTLHSMPSVKTKWKDFLFSTIYMQRTVLQSLERHFKALFMPELWTKAGKSVQCNVLNELVPMCRTRLDEK